MKKTDFFTSQNILLSILNITRAITLSELDLPTAISETLELTTRLTGADIGNFLLYDSDSSTLSWAGSIDTDPLGLRELSSNMSMESIAGLAAKNQTTFAVQDVTNSNYVGRRPPNIRSELAVPIMSRNQVIAVLNLQSSKEDNFDEDSVQTIELFASLLGTVLTKGDLEKAKDKIKSNGLIDRKKDLAFVLMPFREPYYKYYQMIYRPAIEAAGLRSLRVDEIFGPSSISQDIWNNINNAKVVIAELSTRNPNVMYELGLSHAVGKQVIMIAETVDDIPFDLRHLRGILYDTIEPEWASKLKSNIANSIYSILDGKLEKGPYQ